MSKIPFASHIIAEIAPEIGASVWLEPEYGYVGEITFASGVRHLFRNTNFNVNPLGSIEIVKDKGYCSMFLRRYGYQVAQSRTFFRPDMYKNISIVRTEDDGWIYAQSLGLPVIVKPNNLSQGVGVCLVHTYNEYIQAVHTIWERTSVMLIESYHIGNDYRVVVLGDEIISAYMRSPLSVEGDGAHTILELLDILQKIFVAEGRDTIINTTDLRIRTILARTAKTLEYIPHIGEHVQLLDNANLSTGGKSTDITDILHPDWADIAKRVTADMGLRLCGVDILAKDLSKGISENEGYIIIELNGAPGLDNYMSTGESQRNIVKNMYRKILISMSTSII